MPIARLDRAGNTPPERFRRKPGTLLSPFRNRPLGRPAPRAEFRTAIVEGRGLDGIMLDMAGGGSRLLVALIEQGAP
jgi:hypothetical protein